MPLCRSVLVLSPIGSISLSYNGIKWNIIDKMLGLFQTLLKSGCTPTGLTLVGFLVKGDKFILHDGHTLPEMRYAFPAHAPVRHNTSCGEPIAYKYALASLLHNESDC